MHNNLSIYIKYVIHKKINTSIHQYIKNVEDFCLFYYLTIWNIPQACSTCVTYNDSVLTRVASTMLKVILKCKQMT